MLGVISINKQNQVSLFNGFGYLTSGMRDSTCIIVNFSLHLNHIKKIVVK